MQHILPTWNFPYNVKIFLGHLNASSFTVAFLSTCYQKPWSNLTFYFIFNAKYLIISNISRKVKGIIGSLRTTSSFLILLHLPWFFTGEGQKLGYDYAEMLKIWCFPLSTVAFPDSFWDCSSIYDVFSPSIFHSFLYCLPLGLSNFISWSLTVFTLISSIFLRLLQGLSKILKQNITNFPDSVSLA